MKPFERILAYYLNQELEPYKFDLTNFTVFSQSNYICIPL